MKVDLRSSANSQDEPSGFDEGKACRALWCAVMQTHLLDLNSRMVDGNDRKSLVRARAENWIGSKGFRDVCLIIGLDPDAAETAIRNKLARGERFVVNRFGVWDNINANEAENTRGAA